MSKIYGYCRISRKSQDITRQERNIKEFSADAEIYKETFTGTKLQGRKVLDKLLNNVKPGDTIIFDSASRMSRNSAEAMELYERLFQEQINLVFLNERYIDTEMYKKSIENQLKLEINTGDKETDNLITGMLNLLNRYTLDIAKKQIKLVFDSAEREVNDLHTRTAQGIETARLAGKQIGQRKGAKLTTKKSLEAKKVIKKYSQDFDGSLVDDDVIKLAGISRNSYYKYKREIREEMV